MDPQEKVKQLVESAQRHQQAGDLAMLFGLVAICLALVYGAWDVWRNGLRITTTKTVTGKPAIVVALALLLMVVGLVVMGLWFWPGILRY